MRHLRPDRKKQRQQTALKNLYKQLDYENLTAAINKEIMNRIKKLEAKGVEAK